MMAGGDIVNFRAGTAEDDVTHNPMLALDAQVWPLMALPGVAEKFAPAIHLPNSG